MSNTELAILCVVIVGVLCLSLYQGWIGPLEAFLVVLVLIITVVFSTMGMT